MSDFILLTDRKQCPACRRSAAPKGYGQCRNCGMMLFDSGNDFGKYEGETGWREYWVYDKTHGWRHRSHLFSAEDSKPLQISQPLHRVYEPPRLDSDYGNPEYARRKLEEMPERIELKKEYKRLKKNPVTVARL